MSKIQPLIVDKREKVNGLYAYCGKCKRLIENRVCGNSGKRISTCKDTDKHGFRAVITVPGTDGKTRKTKVLPTRDLNEAILLKIEFENELKDNDYQNTDDHVIQTSTRPKLLIECMATYVAHLNNVGVESHMVKIRSKKHLWEVNNFFEKFCSALKHGGLDHKILKIEHVNDRIAGIIHSYILEELKHSNKTYNKMIALYRQFIDWLCNDKGYTLSNPFSKVQRRKEANNNTIIKSQEFQLLLNAIIPANSYQTLASGERKNRYKSWMRNCYRLALETGLRREEFMTIKFSDIMLDENEQPLLIRVQNYKVNRIKGEDFSDEVKFVPITEGLLKLLKDLQYPDFKGSDRFLIGHDEPMSRETLIDFVSKSFSHFWKLTGINKTVQLKHLRKTYLTALVEELGDKASVISNHSGMDVLKKHYVNDQRLVASARGFSVYKD